MRAQVVAVIFVVGIGAACHRSRALASAPKPALGDIVVRDVTPSEYAPETIDGVLLERGLRRRLLATELFSPAPADAGPGPVADLQIRVDTEPVEVGARGEARARVHLRLETRPSDAPGALTFELEGRGTQEYAVPRSPGSFSRSAILGALVLRVASDLVDEFAARRRLYDGPEESVHAALMADGGDLRDEAIRAAGARRLAGEAPILLKLLSDPDESTRDAALGALIALHDQRAVGELTRTRSLRDRHEMRKIIEAIAILGGQEADDYLSFVAASHDDDEIRAAAAAARSRLQRRESDDGGPR
jgi:HEAT repeat protein